MICWCCIGSQDRRRRHDVAPITALSSRSRTVPVPRCRLQTCGMVTALFSRLSHTVNVSDMTPAICPVWGYTGKTTNVRICGPADAPTANAVSVRHVTFTTVFSVYYYVCRFYYFIFLIVAIVNSYLRLM